MSEETIATTSWWERYRDDVAGGKTHTMDVFFRSLAPSQGSHDKRRQILQRLDAAAESTSLETYNIHVIGDGMCLCEDCTSTRIARHMHDTLSSLRDGGSDRIEPTGFSERSVDSEMTGEHYRLLIPPEVTLAVYVGDVLRAAFPARVEGVPVSVSDFLDAYSSIDTESAVSQAEA